MLKELYKKEEGKPSSPNYPAVEIV